MRFKLLPLEPFWFRITAQATPQKIKFDVMGEVSTLLFACGTDCIVCSNTLNFLIKIQNQLVEILRHGAIIAPPTTTSVMLNLIQHLVIKYLWLIVTTDCGSSPQ